MFQVPEKRSEKMAGKKKVPVDGSSEPISNTVLGDLLVEKGLVKEKTVKSSGNTGQKLSPAAGGGFPDLSRVGKIVLRVQRKGRGGKTVTLLSCAGLARSSLDPLAREMRKALGCGSRVEEEGIVLQGDVQERAYIWLSERGATRIVGGS
jgi:translation initiation factor 1 (eIF-1/SUI1)